MLYIDYCIKTRKIKMVKPVVFPKNPTWEQVKGLDLSALYVGQIEKKRTEKGN